ncbi:MAG: PVC-type heme-binding CxxCH protein [Planctomycetaceae bacterium]
MVRCLRFSQFEHLDRGFVISQLDRGTLVALRGAFLHHYFRWAVPAISMAAGLMAARAADPPYTPRIAPASNAGELSISRIVVPEGFGVQLWAAEPLLANPVAFCFDERGRVYVAETFRQNKGAEDNRTHMSWLEDDLASTTVADRLAMLKKHLGEKVVDYTREHDRVRLIEDRDGDGRADHASVFADGFNEIVEGTGAGVLARRGSVWYTNVPRLWRLRDTDGDGEADVREALHEGYGVHVSYRAHDLHGLRMGPDGKLYFTMGDRGLNVTTQEGKPLFAHDRGSVLRCDLDGSNLEIIATGLRNPQDLAFDQYGNLFTCDNDSDRDDQCRWVYLVEGGDCGWRIGYQYFADRGPWNRERLWQPYHRGQAAYILPPIANISDGPSGLTYYPGTGFPAEYAGHFFLVDFRGLPNYSGVRSFAVKPQGASFELIDAREFAWSILASDVEFGPDGALWVSDWVEGWDGPGKGRLYRVTSTQHQNDPVVGEVRRLFAEGFTQRADDELTKLLAHPNMNVRLEAQFALAERGARGTESFSGVLTRGGHQLAQFHALWGLGQLARTDRAVLRFVRPMLAASDPEIRAQAAKVLGDAADSESKDSLIRLVADPEPRVRFFGAQALGKLGLPAPVAPLLALLRDNADRDAFLRHAAVVALARAAPSTELLAAAGDSSPAVRMGVLLALRRRESAEIARFLSDTDLSLVAEAALAIHDMPIAQALPALAGLADRKDLSEPTLWRVINANFRLGEAKHAAAVAALAVRSDIPARLRLEAISALGDWGEPSNRDRLLGSWRPLPPRDPKVAAAAFASGIGELFKGTDELCQAAAKVAGKLKVREAGPELLRQFSSAGRAAETKAEALRALTAIEDSQAQKAGEQALSDMSPLLRTEGRRTLARLQPAAAIEPLRQALSSGEVRERQAALQTLGEIAEPRADRLLAEWLERFQRDVPREIQLDLLEAARRRDVPALNATLAQLESAASHDDPLGPYRVALAGGDAGRGRRIFFEKIEISCVRCHKVNNLGGEIGPDLSKIGAEKQREYLLESLVFPDRQIAKGFDPVVVVTRSGKVFSGTMKPGDDHEAVVLTADGETISIPRSEIEEQVRGKSAMPDDLSKHLSRAELRDLVEFLANLK